MAISVKKSIRYWLVSVPLLSMLACSVQAPLKLLDENHPVRKGTLAVISGSARGGDIYLAQQVTQLLGNGTRFNVMTQQEVVQRLPEYPTVIEMQDSSKISEGDDKATWYSASGKASMDQIQARLGVDYLLVLWIPKITRETPITLHGGQFYHVYAVGNLLEYPGGRAIGATRLHAGESAVWITTRSMPSGVRIENLIDEAAGKIVDSLNDMKTKNR